MIKLEKLYAATDDGLDIITLHYPDAAQAAKTGKPFRMRGERTPSAYVKKFKSKQGFDVWKLTDFGDEGHAKAPIDIHMEQCNLNFAEAVIDLASTFGISDELNKSVNRPVITREPAGPDMKEGELYWEIDQEFTADECQTMGPRVTKEDLVAMHWYRAKYVARVTKDRELVFNHSNEHYPIFIRECWYDSGGKLDRFYKIYKPKEVEKQYRFSYYPRNKKPQQYTNGLFELEAAWKRYNENLEKSFSQDPANEGKNFKPVRFPEAIICSGERDSMCAKALGYWPLWFNSETYRVSDREMSQISRMVETIYNIPDIDSTGILKGRELAMRFIDVHTIWLPSSLSERKDHRGRPRKDFRDWCELYSDKESFKRLMTAATPAKFWVCEFSKKEEERVKYRLDPECLMGFLQLNGFYRLKDEHSQESVFVFIDGNRVRQVKPADMRAFVHRWTVSNGHPRALRNVILTSPYFSSFNLDMLEELNLDFSTNTDRSQIFHFRNASMEVTAGGIRKVDPKKELVSAYVWEDNVVDRYVDILPDMFRISHTEGHLKSEDFDIEITDLRSNFFRYLVNSSRVYWRKEMELRFAEGQEEARKAYCDAHRFDIAGEGLTAEEIHEQKRNLINKIFTVGYLLHRYKDEARPWAPFLMDNVIGQNDQCNGGAGKSFLFVALRNLVNGQKISGRQRDPMGNKHLFERVTRFTDFVYFDDCADNFPFKELYDTISSDVIIDTKNIKSYSLPFKDAPKFAFNSNYVPQEFDPSTVRRMLFVTFSDYYHQSSEDNDYLETRSIADDFGKTLFRENYTDSEWDADFNFMMQCTRFYLSLADRSVKIEPDITNIKYRKYRHDMSDNFLNWAEFYFSEEGDNLDRLIVKEDAFNAYKSFSGVSKITMQRFKKSLIGFCYTCDWVADFNPEQLRNSSGRILKRVKDANGTLEQKEMIYLRSRKAVELHCALNESTDRMVYPSGIAAPGLFPPAPPSLTGHDDYNDYLLQQLEKEKQSGAYGQ